MNVDRGGDARAEGIEGFRRRARFVLAATSQAAKRRSAQICQPGFPHANGGCLDDVEETAAVRIRQAVNELISTDATGWMSGAAVTDLLGLGIRTGKQG